ncbi:MAG: hypothetical protein M3R10_03855, partial [Verrucomicrobiota bacterium]|nr:hypothetical protein [Verrucomicrobiota bacterium]
MRRIRIGLFIVLSLSALGLFVLALAPAIGGGPSRAAIPPQEQDPDLPTGAGDSIDKETYLALRNAWIMSRRGFDAKRDVDPLARERAIAQMGKQLNTLEALRKNRFAIGSATSSDRFSVAAAVSSTAWTPVGPAPLPQGQTSDVVNPVTGRIISIAIHPTNPDIVFVGTASGGLYRTLNGQAANPTWTPLMDTIQMQSNGLN